MSYRSAPLEWKVKRFMEVPRPVKDRIERELTGEACAGRVRGGSIVTLTGPDIERHVGIYEEYFDAIVIVELDRRLAAFMERSLRAIRAGCRSDVFLVRGDVFSYEHRDHLPPVRLLDLDFVTGWSRKIEDDILGLAARFPEAWLRVTYNARSPFSYQRLSGERVMTGSLLYRAVESGPGDPMVTAQFRPIGGLTRIAGG